MSTRPCRDCGYLLGPKMRGCPRCACNVAAENMIEKFIWFRVVPVVVIGVVFLGVLIYMLR